VNVSVAVELAETEMVLGISAPSGPEISTVAELGWGS
jgi:hypothetical protein